MNIENTLQEPQNKSRKWRHGKAMPGRGHGIVHSPLYRKAFVEYLRHNTPPELFLKAKVGSNHIVDKYIWHTQDDDKVRPSHAAHEQELVAWEEPPDIGHPGDAYNCRCVAEPYLDGLDPSDLKEINFETVISAAEENPKRLDSIALANHYLNGHGKPVTLQEIGHLKEIIDYVQNHPIDANGHSIARRAMNDFSDQVRKTGVGLFHGAFVNTYDFKPVEWAHGRSTLSGEAHGYISSIGPFLVFNLTIDYRFSDIFRDPLDVVQTQDYLDENGIVNIRPRITVEPGTPYAITGTWRARIEAVIYQDKNLSAYYQRNEALK
jgi:Phage Mu protein F like protein